MRCRLRCFVNGLYKPPHALVWHNTMVFEGTNMGHDRPKITWTKVVLKALRSLKNKNQCRFSYE